MAAPPPKPWERAGVNSQHQESPFSNSMSSGTPDMTVLGGGAGSGIPSAAPAPPALPPRPGQQTGASAFSSPGYSSYGSGGYGGYSGMHGSGGMYGGGMYGSSMYGGYGGGYGGYGGGMYGSGGMYGGMNRYGMDQNGQNPNSFVRAAEENSRQAFQSVESVVHAFGSVAMMLESTFYALFNSFRAVIGVADQMSRVKAHFAQIFSALAVIKTLRWLYRKLLVLLRLRKAGLPEDVWQQAANESVKSVFEQELSGATGKKSTWPIIMFFGIVMGGPWLVWKLLSAMSPTKDFSEWMNGKSDHFMAVGQHSFTGQRDEELSFARGQKIIIAPKECQPQVRGWLLACVDGKKTGLIPANYIKIIGKKRGTRQQNQATALPSQQMHHSESASAVNLENEFQSQALTKSMSSPNFENAFGNQNDALPVLQHEIKNIEEQTASDILNDVTSNGENG